MSEPAAPPLERILERSDTGARSIVDLALHRDPEKPPTVAAARPPTVKGELGRQLHNRPVKVPRCDWEQVLLGTKRMYRTYSDSWRERFARLFPVDEVFPRPVVIYSQIGHARSYDAAVAIVTGYRQEPLGAITPADLELEGFVRGPGRLERNAAMRRYRRYWKQRYWRWGWRPYDQVSVVELRPWIPGVDEAQWGAWLLDRLFGEWLG